MAFLASTMEQMRGAAAGPAAGGQGAARFCAGLQALVGMGFPEAASRSALDAARGGVDAAVELLLAG